jgi:transposase-like protein
MSGSRIFGRDFKLAALSRMESGENVSALSRELKIRRKLLYEWRDAFRAGGAEALRGQGRRRKGSVVVGARSSVSPGWRKAEPGGRSSMASEDELAVARRRIAELERKLGQQALEADFFRQALRLFETPRRPSDRSGGTASMASSRPGPSGKAD